MMRRWAKNRMPPDIVKRPKRGFQTGNISELLQHDGAMIRSRVLDSPGIRRLVPGTEGWMNKIGNEYGGPWGGTLWALLVLAVWCESVGIE